MKQDKFLIGIVVGIVLLVIVALVVVMSRSPGSEEYIADNTPEGVVHNYFLAMQRKEYEKAYGYLSDDLASKPTLDQFINDVQYSGSDSESSLKIGDVRPGDVHTQVDITITNYRTGNIFENSSYSTEDTVFLKATDGGGVWKITLFPYPYWGWNWDQEQE